MTQDNTTSPAFPAVGDSIMSTVEYITRYVQMNGYANVIYVGPRVLRPTCFDLNLKPGVLHLLSTSQGAADRFLAVNLAACIGSCRQPLATGVFNTRWSMLQLSLHILSVLTGVKLCNLRNNGPMTCDCWNLVMQALVRIKDVPVFLDPAVANNIAALCEQIRRMHAARQIEAAFVGTAYAFSPADFAVLERLARELKIVMVAATARAEEKEDETPKNP